MCSSPRRDPARLAHPRRQLHRVGGLINAVVAGLFLDELLDEFSTSSCHSVPRGILTPGGRRFRPSSGRRRVGGGATFAGRVSRSLDLGRTSVAVPIRSEHLSKKIEWLWDRLAVQTPLLGGSLNSSESTGLARPASGTWMRGRRCVHGRRGPTALTSRKSRPLGFIGS